MGQRGSRQRSVGVSALFTNHCTPHIHGTTVLQRCFNIGIRLSRHGEHGASKLNGQFDDIRGATTGKNLDGFFKFKGITDLESQRGGHIGQESLCFHSGIAAQVHHGAG